MAKKLTRKLVPRETMHGKPVVDATAPLILKIERQDAKGAKAGSPEKCGAARALVRQEGALHAYVFRSRVYVEHADRVERYCTPARLRQETISFDRGAPDKYLDGDYRLRPPLGSDKLGADHRASTRGGGADKRGAPPMPRFAVQGGRPINTSRG